MSDYDAHRGSMRRIQSHDTLELSVQIVLCHFDDRRTAVRTVIGIFQGQEFVDQGIRLLQGQHAVSLDGCLTGHGGNFFRNAFRSGVSDLCQLIQDFREQAVGRNRIQIIRNGIDLEGVSSFALRFTTIAGYSIWALIFFSR